MEAKTDRTDPTSPHDGIPNWVPYDGADRTYFGAGPVVAAELKYILGKPGRRERADTGEGQPLAGLALSGGGIRSASFCLGVMQALAYQDWLNEVDYLSTVSGGGYIGSSVSWLVHQSWTVPDASAAGGARTVDFGTRWDNFPYGTYPMSGTLHAQPKAPAAADGLKPSDKGSMLRFVRQNAKYLVPGRGINILSLAAAVLRGGLVSIAVYFGLLMLVFLGLQQVGFFGPVQKAGITALQQLPAAMTWPLFLALLAVTGFLLFAFLFALLSWVRSSYGWRRAFDVGAKNFITAALIFLVLAALPWVHEGIGQIALWLASGDSAGATESLTEWLGVASTALGVLSAIGAFARSGKKEGKLPVGLLAGLAVTLLLFGLLLLGYRLSAQWAAALKSDGLDSTSVLVTLGAVAILGFAASLNRVSIHRFYRDRLMETFLPDVDNALLPAGNRPQAKLADRKKLSAMANAHPGPYHIVNTNVVLVGSKRPKFKGRGGDNFILSPLYCGSNATGWRDTHSYANNDMTLASAMAISGAAVNPSAGCGGEGVTRSALMSVLMGLLNIRLGYWSLNPDPERQPLTLREPNHWVPGLWELIVRSQLSEDNAFLQLSDGGHFENLGLYELIRRKLKVIIVCDGGADPNYTFSDLANALEKARVDFGVLVNLDGAALSRLVPRPKPEHKDDPKAERYAETGHLVTDIIYADNTRGKLIYLTTTFFEHLSADLYGYRREHPQFPDEPTSDQFFSEKQFEAYRELGYLVAMDMMCDPAIGQDQAITAIFPFNKAYCEGYNKRRSVSSPSAGATRKSTRKPPSKSGG